MKGVELLEKAESFTYEFFPISAAKQISEYEQLYTKFCIVAGISVEQAIELFAKGYILTPGKNVSISDVMEELK